MNKNLFKTLVFTLLNLLFLIGCKPKNVKINRAFYFWKSSFDLSEKERDILKENRISRLYIKYFDVVWNSQLNNAVPVAKIYFKQAVPEHLQVVPVVYITNKVLQNLSIDSVNNLAISISTLIKQYKSILKKNSTEIQIDCDWTLSTKDKYFKLLKAIKKEFGNTVSISATIRLHQIKYASTTGIPPVQKGMFMYYNMGDLQSAKSNSIFNEVDAEKYAPYIKQYPLPLDVVLPVFRWVKVFRNQHMVKLLNQTTLLDLQQAGAFKSINNLTIQALNTAQYKDFNYLENDIFVEENMSPELSLKAIKHLHQYYNSTNFTLALFHLHQPNLNEFTTQDIEDLYTAFN